MLLEAIPLVLIGAGYLYLWRSDGSTPNGEVWIALIPMLFIAYVVGGLGWMSAGYAPVGVLILLLRVVLALASLDLVYDYDATAQAEMFAFALYFVLPTLSTVSLAYLTRPGLPGDFPLETSSAATEPARQPLLPLGGMLVLEVLPAMAIATLLVLAWRPGQLSGGYYWLLLPGVLPGIGWLFSRQSAGCSVVALHGVLRVALIIAFGVAGGAIIVGCDPYRDDWYEGIFEYGSGCAPGWYVGYGLSAALLVAIPIASATFLALSSPRHTDVSRLTTQR